MSVPVSCCLSAAGIRFSGHPNPARELGLPHGRLTGTQPLSPDPDGVTTFHTHEPRPGWVPPVSRGRRCSPGRPQIPDRRLPIPSGQPLYPLQQSISEAAVNETSTEVHAIHPSGLALACSPRMERGPSGLNPELRTPPLPAAHVRAGTGHRARARNYATDNSRPSCLRVHSQRATSCRNLRYCLTRECL
jgi:hypothetical protein